MKLYHFHDPQGNFGDDLNPWLWPRLAPWLLDDDERELFVGIGTLLNHRVPTEPVKHVFGSGHGYGTKPVIDTRWVFHAVRGFDTARVLGVPRDRVITDAAVLLRALDLPRSPQQDVEIGFIPHCQSERDYDWASVAHDLGWHPISVQWDVERVLHELSRCQRVVCEAMHGAIVADALRIPWTPVACYDSISSFKWRDWLSTLELPYAPARIPSLFDVDRNAGTVTRAKHGLKRGLARAGIAPAGWTPPPPAPTSARLREQALQALRAAAQGRQYLSDDALIERHTERYLEVLEGLRVRKSPTSARLPSDAHHRASRAPASDAVSL